MLRRAAATTLLLVCVGGCAGVDTEPTSAVSVRDSAGITVVDVRGPLADVAATEWTLDTVFSTARTGVELFRVIAGRVLADGRLLIGDEGNLEVLMLDPAGRLDGRVGREGQGPGEFGGINAIHSMADGGFAVYDPRLARWTYFDRSGGLVSTEAMMPPNRVVDLLPLARDASNRLVAIYGQMRTFAQDGVRRDTTPLLRYPEIASDPDTLGMWAVEEWSYAALPSGGVSRSYVGFGRSLAAFGRDGLAVLGDTDVLDVAVFDAAGTHLMRIVGGAEPIAVTDAEGERWRQERIASLPANASEWRRDQLAGAPFRETYPAFDAVAVDDAGRVWIGTAARLGDRARVWIVFDGEGAPVGRIELAADVEILDIAHGLLLLLHTDELDVESVALYSLSAAPS